MTSLNSLQTVLWAIPSHLWFTLRVFLQMKAMGTVKMMMTQP